MGLSVFSIFLSKDTLKGAILLWWLGSCLVALAGLVFGHTWLPQSLPVPWSHIGDFVETPDGRVYVDIGLYNRVVCHDRSGRFIASYRYPQFGTAIGLAASKNGNVYFKVYNTVYTMTADWQVAGKAEASREVPRAWLLGPDQQPVHAPERADDWAPDRAVEPGEMLFSHSWMRGGPLKRQTFVCSDGSLLVRGQMSVKRVSRQEAVLCSYRGPWLYWPFVFPLPGQLSWVAMLLWVLWAARKSRRRPAEPGEAVAPAAAEKPMPPAPAAAGPPAQP